MDADAISRLISARCGDALAPADLTTRSPRCSPARKTARAEVYGLIVDAIDALEERFDRLEEAAFA